MPWDLLIRNGQCVLREGVMPLDLAIEGGKIVELKAGLSGKTHETINATGLHVFPGVIDPHVHFNEPGRTEWEGFATGSAALAAGGGTCFFDMPLNSSPPTLDGPSFDFKLEAAKRESLTDFALWGGLTPKNLDSMEQLADRGVIGFKAFMCPSGIGDFDYADLRTLERGMEIAAKLGLIVAVHAEDPELLSSQRKNVKGTRWKDYLDSRPVECEAVAINAAIDLSRATGCSLYIVHVSSPALVEMIDDRRQADPGLKVTVETCPHYFTLHDKALDEIGARAKCSPPLRSEDDMHEMRRLLGGGRAFGRKGVEVIGSDHSPSPAKMKTSKDAFANWGGISGIQSTLSATLTAIWGSRAIGTEVDLLGGKVAALFGLESKREIAHGWDADLALVDINSTYTLTRDMLLDRHKLSPYVGRQFRGLVKRTISRGQKIFLDGNIVGKPKGRLITPTRKERA